MPTPNLQSNDYYAILGVPRDADDSALRKAYKKLAVKWHPDKNPDNDEATKNFQKISEAYATLSDSKKRQLYDQYGVDGVNAADQMGDSAPGGSPFHRQGGFPGGGRTSFHFSPGGGSTHMSPDDAQEFFAHFFGHDDPFGGMGMHGMRGGMPGGRVAFSGPGRGGGVDPISMMFGGMDMHQMGGMPGGMSGGRPGVSARRAQPKRYDAIPNGTVVSLKGLVNRADRNGDRGEIQDYDPSSGRYTVLVEDSDEYLRVKPSNLLQHVHVRLYGLESKPELNGKTGSIIAWSEQKQRYSIYVMAESKAVSLKPGNVILNEGTVGMIVGLASKPELNGRYGTIKAWLREANRYEVQLSANQVISVKVENVRV